MDYRRRGLFFDVYSLGLLVMSVVGGVPSVDRCRFETNTSRTVDCLRCAGSDLHMWDAMGMVKSEKPPKAGPQQQLAAPFHFWLSAIAVTAGSICLLAVPSVAIWTIPASKGLIARLHNDALNARDMDQQRRGYYEELDVGRTENWAWHGAEEPEGWSKGKKAFVRERVGLFIDRCGSVDEHGSWRRVLHFQFPRDA